MMYYQYGIGHGWLVNLDLELSLLCISTQCFQSADTGSFLWREVRCSDPLVYIFLSCSWIQDGGGGGGGKGSDVGCPLEVMLGGPFVPMGGVWAGPWAVSAQLMQTMVYNNSFPVHSQFASLTWNAVCRGWAWCFSRWICPLQDGPGCGSILLHHSHPGTLGAGIGGGLY